MVVLWKPLIQLEKTDVQERFVRWYEFMEKNVKFHMDDSELHTKHHCARVLLFALKITSEYGLDDEDTDALAWAAVFHDSRRQDDWLDVGHGQRAAEYYRDFCDRNGIMADERVYRVMAYHDRDDVLGISQMEAGNLKNGVILYQIFKDADALDRFRIAPDALDTKFLRTEAAQNMVVFAKKFVQQTQFAAQDMIPGQNRFEEMKGRV